MSRLRMIRQIELYLVDRGWRQTSDLLRWVAPGPDARTNTQSLLGALQIQLARDDPSIAHP